MAIEDVRVRLRHKLEEAFGPEEASYLMDRPPGGWSELVTTPVLDARLEAVEHRILAAVDRRLRAQTWVTTTTLVAGLTIATAVARLT